MPHLLWAWTAWFFSAASACCSTVELGLPCCRQLPLPQANRSLPAQDTAAELLLDSSFRGCVKTNFLKVNLKNTTKDDIGNFYVYPLITHRDKRYFPEGTTPPFRSFCQTTRDFSHSLESWNPVYTSEASVCGRMPHPSDIWPLVSAIALLSLSSSNGVLLYCWAGLLKKWHKRSLSNYFPVTYNRHSSERACVKTSFCSLSRCNSNRGFFRGFHVLFADIFKIDWRGGNIKDKNSKIRQKEG